MRLVMQQPDGTVRIIVPASDKMTPEDVLKRWREAVPDGADCEHVATVKPEDVPSDRTFREAWRHSEKGLHVDMEIAKKIHKSRMGEDPAIHAAIEKAATPEELKAIQTK